MNASSSIDATLRRQALAAIARALNKTVDPSTQPINETGPGSLAELQAHLDALIEIVRRSTATRIEPYLVQILDEICAKCPHCHPCGTCSLRQSGHCILFASAAPIVVAIADVLDEVSADRRMPNIVPQEEARRLRHAAQEQIMFNRILIALEAGDQAHLAQSVGAELARRENASLGLIHVVHPPIEFDECEAVRAAGVVRRMRSFAEHFLAQIRSELPGELRVDQFIKEGRPAEEIVETARQWNADLIIVGISSHSRLTRLILGSTADSVVRNASCPVLVMREKAHPAAKAPSKQAVEI